MAWFMHASPSGPVNPPIKLREALQLSNAFLERCTLIERTSQTRIAESDDSLNHAQMRIDSVLSSVRIFLASKGITSEDSAAIAHHTHYLLALPSVLPEAAVPIDALMSASDILRARSFHLSTALHSRRMALQINPIWRELKEAIRFASHARNYLSEPLPSLIDLFGKPGLTSGIFFLAADYVQQCLAKGKFLLELVLPGPALIIPIAAVGLMAGFAPMFFFIYRKLSFIEQLESANSDAQFNATLAQLHDSIEEYGAGVTSAINECTEGLDEFEASLNRSMLQDEQL